MALIAMSTVETREFVSDMDPDKKVEYVPVDEADPEKGFKPKITIGENASVFKIRPLDVHLMGHIYDNASVIRGKQGESEVGIHTRVNQTNIDCVRFGLAALPSNFRDDKGKAIALNTIKEVVNGRQYYACDNDVLNSLGIRLINEMAQEIKSISEVTPAVAKN